MDLKRNELLQLIELYFECRLTDDEERCLRQTVAFTDISDPAIDEVRAVMGLRRRTDNVSEKRQQSSKILDFKSKTWFIGVAACVAIVLMAGFWINIGTVNAGNDVCLAYVDGHEVTDENEVMKLLAESLSEFDSGQEELTREAIDDLELIVPIIDSYENDECLNL